MKVQQVVLTGGTGFVGSHISYLLDAAGYQVKILTRQRNAARHLILLPNVQVVECDLLDEGSLDTALAGADAVINLVGILHADQGPTDFYRYHAELPASIAASCKRNGISRLIHMSALNADINGASDYLRSKAEGEAAIKTYGLDWTIFRPSVIFGAGDSFLTLFAKLSRLMPVFFLASPEARFQPIWVEDVASVVLTSLQKPETSGKTYNLCGPGIYTLRQLVAYAAQCVNKKPPIIGLNPSLSWLQAWMMELLPIKLMTRDNLRSMQKDSICKDPFPAVFDLNPTALEAIAPQYLGGETPRADYLRFRCVAGR